MRVPCNGSIFRRKRKRKRQARENGDIFLPSISFIKRVCDEWEFEEGNNGTFFFNFDTNRKQVPSFLSYFSTFILKSGSLESAQYGSLSLQSNLTSHGARLVYVSYYFYSKFDSFIFFYLFSCASPLDLCLSKRKLHEGVFIVYLENIFQSLFSLATWGIPWTEAPGREGFSWIVLSLFCCCAQNF